MVINNLNFYDKFGKNLNFDLNSTGEYFEGKIFFPELSSYLFDNENIFILEKSGSDYKFPTLNQDESIVFEWKNLDSESSIFLYEVERDLDLNNFFINKKDQLEIKHSDILPGGSSQLDIKLPMQINIAFNPIEEVKYSRYLNVYLVDDAGERTKLAEIEFYGEGLEEDERFGTWARNFGIKFNREDANILKDYDIKEAFPDWKQLNLARKTLLVNKEHVYPYIGTYKGLSNFVNLLGYKDVLQIKEYWKNYNPKSSYYDKQALVDITDYLDDGKIDNMNILDVNKNLKFGKQFKKTEFLALVYQFNRETGSFDDDGIPELEETTTFTVDEVFYKLNRLKEKVKNEFLPINVQIKDVIGEFLYFQKITVKFWKDDTPILDLDMNESAEVQVYPNLDSNLIIRSLDPLFKKANESGPDFGTVQLNLKSKNPYDSSQRYPASNIPDIIKYVKEFYSEIKTQKYPDIGARLTWEDGDDPETIVGAPVILNIFTEKFTFTNFKGIKFEDLDSYDSSIDPYFTLENVDFRNFYEITWKITKDSPNPYNFTYRGKIKDLSELPHFLPYTGRYRVTAELHDMYGNTSVFSKFVTVEDIQKPQIVGISRLEDKFDYTVDNLNNVRLIDFGASPNYLPKVNVLDSESAFSSIDPYKNLLEWQWFFKNRYGTGQSIYDAELWDSNTGTYVPYNDPAQSHPKKSYWGLGDTRPPIKLEDFKDMTMDSLFFTRLKDLIYVDDFSAGFYLTNPKPGQTIKISLYSNYVLPNFVSTEDLVTTLNNSTHFGIKLFNYESLTGPNGEVIIHAESKYLNKDMYHILYSDGTGSPASPRTSPASPSGGSANLDEYTFFLPKEVYSDRLINYLQDTFPAFDSETLFMFAKTSDIINGTVQTPSFWVNNKYWKFSNDIQTGYIPTVIDQNSFSMNDVKIFEDSFNVPENNIVFFVVNNIDGKNEFIWTLTDSLTGEEIVKVRSVPFFVWKFKDLGQYTIKVDVFDNRGNFYSNQIDKMINVQNKKQYISNIEARLNRRKLTLLNKNN